MKATKLINGIQYTVVKVPRYFRKSIVEDADAVARRRAIEERQAARDGADYDF